MKLKKILVQTALCTALFSASLSTTAYAANYVFADALLGTYNNTDENKPNSYFVLRNDTYNMTAINVHATNRDLWFRGATPDAYNTSTGFYSTFDQVRELDNNGNFIGGDNDWIKNVRCDGSISTKTVFFKKTTTITMKDGYSYSTTK